MAGSAMGKGESMGKFAILLGVFTILFAVGCDQRCDQRSDCEKYFQLVFVDVAKSCCNVDNDCRLCERGCWRIGKLKRNGMCISLNFASLRKSPANRAHVRIVR